MRFLVAVLMSLTAIVGCVSDDGPDDDLPAAPTGYPYSDGDYLMEGEWSTPLQEVLYDALPGVKVRVPVRDGVEMSVALFLPDKPGCDWDAAALPDACRLPVVMSASPYYLQSIGDPSGRPPLPLWLVPRDFIVVQMSLRGTGESAGCMEYKDPKDVDDISDVVDWIVAQAWSNQNVGVAGRSYLGTSAWAAAASGNPHIKTIMPISGAVSSPQLLFRNGTHELRALIPHIPIYWANYAITSDTSDAQFFVEHNAGNICPGVVEPHVFAPLTVATGDAGSEFWQNRDLRQPILDNYDGSVWVIHGMTDWNVDPSQAVPWINDMLDAGIPVRGWLGQWNHHYPDNTVEHWNVRWDWSTQVVDWFEYWLRGNTTMPPMGIEVEDDTYRWRIEERYPPRANWTEVELDLADGILTHSSFVFIDWTASAAHVAGLIQIKIQVTPAGPGGQIMAELYDMSAAKRIGWGVIDVRNKDGGNTDPQVIVPGQSVTVHMQFEPADSPIAEGDQLRLMLTRTSVEDINPDLMVHPIVVESAVVRLPTVEPAEFLKIPLPEGDPRRS